MATFSVFSYLYRDASNYKAFGQLLLKGAASVADIEMLHKVLQTVETEDRLLKQIPTWPWQPEALRSVVATLLLPIILRLIQQLIQRFLS